MSDAGAKEFYITYNGVINAENMNILLNSVKSLREKGFNHIHLLLSSEGGEVYPVIAAYNLLSSLTDITYTTYNISKIGSAANLLFALGHKRYAHIYSFFLFHEIRNFIRQPTTIKMSDAIGFYSDSRKNQDFMVDIFCKQYNQKRGEIEWLFSSENSLPSISSNEQMITAHTLGMIECVIDELPRIDDSNHTILHLNKELSF